MSDKWDGYFTEYLENVLLAGSAFLRAILGGNGRETLSQATERGHRAGKWWCSYLLRPIINGLFLLLGQKNHTGKSLEGDETISTTLWDWGK